MSEHCCEMMPSNVDNTCPDHPDRSDCLDCLVEYRPKSGSYGLLIHDGGSSMIGINFCPWCGANLEERK